MKTVHNPFNKPQPAGYSHGIEVSSPARTLYVAGQLGLAADGSIPEEMAGQTALVFQNMNDVLSAAGMTFEDIVKTTVFLVDPADRAEYVRARREAVGEITPASTLVYVKQLARPEFKLEVEAIAVKAI
jgi:2-iminobutanoate/2-iminopropanoate deaminase